MNEQIDQMIGKRIGPRDEKVQSKGEAGNRPVELVRVVQIGVECFADVLPHKVTELNARIVGDAVKVVEVKGAIKAIRIDGRNEKRQG